jgi:hypothetical protein
MTYADQAHFGNYDPSSFGWPHQVPDLVPFSFDGTNFGQCARAAHGVFTAILTELVPHIPGGINFGPHDDWAYSTTDDLPDGSWSFHRYGIAFDLNWAHNPMGTYSTNPDAGQQGAIPHDIASAIAHKYGCEYGGDWSGGEGHRGFKDYMHFEVHLSPVAARAVQPLNTNPDQGEEMALSPEAQTEIRSIVRAELTNFFHAKDGKPYGIESLIREALADVIANVKADLATDKAELAKDGG